ncbi:hypothetical protein [Paludibacter sp. 221]|uniref:hypothetical protein n=1 Tax=Paludibacter sp. 221 TaxID=2302939 RepID=UPI0013D2EBC8|nr:hypothetical protein [Paludibacter sp. 221]
MNKGINRVATTVTITEDKSKYEIKTINEDGTTITGIYTKQQYAAFIEYLKLFL